MKKTILYAEDHPDLRELALIHFQINFPNHNIETFEDGTLLEERLEGGVNGVCAVVTDNNMPGVKGFKIIDKYAPKIEVPFILFYAGDESIGEDLTKKYENVNYVQKPGVTGLMDTLRGVL